MPRILVIFGLAFILVSLLVRLLAVMVQAALPLGLLLLVVGAIWHLVGRAQKGSQADKPGS